MPAEKRHPPIAPLPAPQPGEHDWRGDPPRCVRCGVGCPMLAAIYAGRFDFGSGWRTEQDRRDCDEALRCPVAPSP